MSYIRTEHKMITMSVISENSTVAYLLREYLFKKRKFSLMVDSPQDLEARLYASAIMEKTEEPGWRVRHVAKDVGVSEESASKIIEIIEGTSYVTKALTSALFNIEERTLSTEDIKLFRYYQIRYRRLLRRYDEMVFVKEFDPYNLAPQSYFDFQYDRYRTSFLSEDGIISIIWNK